MQDKNLDDYTQKLGAKGVTFAVRAGKSTRNTEDYVGIVSGYFNNETGMGYSFVSILHVRQDYRRCKIGNLLMKKVIAYSKELGLGAVRLQVKKMNAPAISFYKHLGFEIIGCVDGKYDMQYTIP